MEESAKFKYHCACLTEAEQDIEWRFVYSEEGLLDPPVISRAASPVKSGPLNSPSLRFSMKHQAKIPTPTSTVDFAMAEVHAVSNPEERGFITLISNTDMSPQETPTFSASIQQRGISSETSDINEDVLTVEEIDARIAAIDEEMSAAERRLAVIDAEKEQRKIAMLSIVRQETERLRLPEERSKDIDRIPPLRATTVRTFSRLPYQNPFEIPLSPLPVLGEIRGIPRAMSLDVSTNMSRGSLPRLTESIPEYDELSPFYQRE